MKHKKGLHPTDSASFRGRADRLTLNQRKQTFKTYPVRQKTTKILNYVKASCQSKKAKEKTYPSTFCWFSG